MERLPFRLMKLTVIDSQDPVALIVARMQHQKSDLINFQIVYLLQINRRPIPKFNV